MKSGYIKKIVKYQSYLQQLGIQSLSNYKQASYDSQSESDGYSSDGSEIQLPFLNKNHSKKLMNMLNQLLIFTENSLIQFRLKILNILQIINFYKYLEIMIALLLRLKLAYLIALTLEKTKLRIFIFIILTKINWPMIKQPFILLVFARDLAMAINQLEQNSIFHADIMLRNIVLYGVDQKQSFEKITNSQIIEKLSFKMIDFGDALFIKGDLYKYTRKLIRIYKSLPKQFKDRIPLPINIQSSIEDLQATSRQVHKSVYHQLISRVFYNLKKKITQRSKILILDNIYQRLNSQIGEKYFNYWTTIVYGQVNKIIAQYQNGQLADFNSQVINQDLINYKNYNTKNNEIYYFTKNICIKNNLTTFRNYQQDSISSSQSESGQSNSSILDSIKKSTGIQNRIEEYQTIQYLLHAQMIKFIASKDVKYIAKHRNLNKSENNFSFQVQQGIPYQTNQNLKLKSNFGWSDIHLPIILPLFARDLARGIRELQQLNLFGTDIYLRNIILTLIGMDLSLALHSLTQQDLIDKAIFKIIDLGNVYPVQGKIFPVKCCQLQLYRQLIEKYNRLPQKSCSTSPLFICCSLSQIKNVSQIYKQKHFKFYQDCIQQVYGNLKGKIKPQLLQQLEKYYTLIKKEITGCRQITKMNDFKYMI